jgi:hypothetical protein
MKRYLPILLVTFFSIFVFSDSPPLSVVGIKGETDGTKIGNVGDALKVNVTNGGGSSTVNQGAPGPSPWPVSISNTPLSVNVGNFPSTQAVTQSGTWTTGRTWDLSSLTDSVDVGNFPSSFSVTQGTSPWLTSRNWNLSSGSDSVASAQSGTWNVGVTNFPSTFGVTQSTSPWVTSRNWTLSSGTDSVNVGNFPATQPISGTVTANQGTPGATPWPVTVSNSSIAVTQSTSPWVTSRNWNLSSGSDSVASVQSGTWTTGRTWSLSHSTDSISDWLSDGSGNAINSTSGALNSFLTNSSIAVTGTFFQATQPISAVSLPLPTGASTSANQTNGTQKTQIVDGSNTTVGPVQTISGSNYMPVVLAASGTNGSAVPSRTIQVGGSDGTNERTFSTDTSGNLNVNIVSNGGAGRTSVTNTVNNYASVNVTTSAYVTLISSTAQNINQVNIFDSSGRTLYLSYAATCGALASSSNTILIVPGGSGLITWLIPSGNCVGIEAQDANATSGVSNITYLK